MTGADERGTKMRATIATTYALALLLAVGCSRPGAPPPAAAESPAIEVIARGLELSAPDRVASGWNTFRFRNESAMTHFAVIEKLPEGIGVAEQQEQVAPIFQQGLELLNRDDTDGAMAKFGELPGWFRQVVFLGGPGLTGPGVTSEATVRLEPGEYLLECYVKTDGIFHSYNPTPGVYGMVHGFTVTEELSDEAEPTPTATITLASQGGIDAPEEVPAGLQTFAVGFEDQKLYENFVGHDLHLVRLTDDADLEKLAAWMDWRAPHGLETPAPALFLGGLNEMPAGSTGYLRVNLEPGRYAWVGEVADPAAKGFLKLFTVSAP